LRDEAENLLPNPEIIAVHPPLLPAFEILQAEPNDVIGGLPITFLHDAMHPQAPRFMKVVV
jgi:hypothetical protein